MDSISIRKRKDGSSSYLARMRLMRDGASYHETRTFDRRPAATAWIKKREKELLSGPIHFRWMACFTVRKTSGEHV